MLNGGGKGRKGDSEPELRDSEGWERGWDNFGWKLQAEAESAPCKRREREKKKKGKKGFALHASDTRLHGSGDPSETPFHSHNNNKQADNKKKNWSAGSQ